ncbi:MAG TPA: GNAT family N-acetyltransferase [Candidatus Thiothrix moscowensis]|nr:MULTISPECIES: GNAT family N-acetyltransferase [unclassified Thiothrix]HRJ51557.1 GNAT family N-acetyltransferase [Candidatus Thiothrix moscowensis]HRJ91872.1 GNAT family N-acetyltransferase [Candidatus Thiothrix moscowensis]
MAVDQDYQRQGIGKQLQILTLQQLGRHCKLILIAAPAANAYYGRIGYTHMPCCWVWDGGLDLKS